LFCASIRINIRKNYFDATKHTVQVGWVNRRYIRQTLYILHCLPDSTDNLHCALEWTEILYCLPDSSETEVQQKISQTYLGKNSARHTRQVLGTTAASLITSRALLSSHRAWASACVDEIKNEKAFISNRFIPFFASLTCLIPTQFLKCVVFVYGAFFLISLVNWWSFFIVSRLKTSNFHASLVFTKRERKYRRLSVTINSI
jgi:hypothetical protein